MSKSIAVLALLGALLACREVPPPDSSVVGSRLEQARLLLRAEGPEKALSEFESVLQAYQTLGDVEGEAITLGHIGTCYKNLGRYTLSIDYHQQALTKKRSLGLRVEEAKTLSNLGLTHWELGDYETAADHFEQSVAIARELENRRIEAAVLNNLGLVYDEWGEYRRSLEIYHESLEMHRASGDSESLSYTLGNIGGVHLLLGHFQTALDYYLEALELSRELGLRPGESIDLGNLALCYVELGDSDRALQVLGEALQLAEETGQLKEQAYWHGGIGSALLRLGYYSEALSEYQKALSIYETSHARREVMETLGQIGTLELLLGDLRSAEKRFEQALQEARSIEHPREIIQSLISLGESARLSGRLGRAEGHFDEALKYSVEIQDQASQASVLMALAELGLERSRFLEARGAATDAIAITRRSGSQPREAWGLKLLGDGERLEGSAESALGHYDAALGIAEKVRDPEITWQLEHARGLALRDLGLTSDATRALSESVRVIESSRFQLDTRSQRAGFLDRRFQPYLDVIQILVTAGDVQSAFHFAERLRASLRLDQMERTVIPRVPGLKPEERELGARIRHLRTLIREEEEKSPAQQRVKAVTTFRAELEETETSYQEYLSGQRQASDQETRARIVQVPTMEQIQRQLPPETALFEFLQTEEQLLLFVLTRNFREVFQIDLGREQLTTKLEIFLELIREKGGDSWVAPSTSLHEKLIEPVRQRNLLRGINHLYLVPHADLNYLPFAALATQKDGEIRFLADDFQLTYLPSAAVLAGGSPRSEATEGLLALAPEKARLQFVREELLRVSEHFEGNSVVLDGEEASESEFHRLASRFRIIHLATHARFNKLNPLLSSIELEEGGGHDGLLRVEDILNLEINADLVTLSACETAIGGGFFAAVPAGDDFVGLTRAFLQAGSRSVLASLWQVNDRSTLEFMTQFYSQMATQPVEVALSSAQVQLRALEPRFRHPYYWAPFVLVSGYGKDNF